MKTESKRVARRGWVAGFLLVFSVANALGQFLENPPRSLRGVPVPLPAALDTVVTNRAAAVMLGKALFWDMSVGSDGKTACATCHFNAGADNRRKNSLSPHGFGFPAGGANKGFAPGKGPNYLLSARNFPLKKADDDVVSSQGIAAAKFSKVTRGSAVEAGTVSGDKIFSVGGIEVRQVEPRNTPTVINGVFNHRNFWDGRANNVFNGVNELGARDTNAVVYVSSADCRTFQKTTLRLENASAASQAVVPIVSDEEMAFRGRTPRHLERKLFSLRPLQYQRVSATDSVLGPQRHSSGNGLKTSYADLIKKAFAGKYWNYSGTINGYSQMEQNFTLFFGVSVMLYEATLVSDDSPFDRFAAGDSGALTARQLHGFSLFLERRRCANCHAGPALTDAAVALSPNTNVIQRLLFDPATGSGSMYDMGFYNIAVTAAASDRGVGGIDRFGNSLSFTEQYVRRLLGKATPDVFAIDPCRFRLPFSEDLLVGAECDAVPTTPAVINALLRDGQGAFKTPTLRNVELTGPYFHNGGKATLRQVVDFYDRGGDFRAENGLLVHPDIQPIGLTPADADALVDFMISLTDERVRYQRAPFDHPAITIPVGAKGNEKSVVAVPGKKIAAEESMRIAEVGAAGSPKPLKTFLGLDPFKP